MGLRTNATVKIDFVKMPPSSCALWLPCHFSFSITFLFLFNFLAPERTKVPLMLSARTLASDQHLKRTSACCPPWIPCLPHPWLPRLLGSMAGRRPHLLDVATPLIASTPCAANLLGVTCRRSPRRRVLPVTQYRSGDMEPNLSGRYYVLPFPWFVRLIPVQQSSWCDVWNLWEAQSSSLIYYLLITIDV